MNAIQKHFLSVNYQLTNAMYCEVDNLEVTREMIENVKQQNERD